MNPQEAEAAKELLLARMVEPSNKAHYQYSPVNAGSTSLLAHDGEIVTTALDADAPANTSVWKPPSVGPGLLAYFDAGTWRVGTDITKLTLAQYQALAIAQATDEFELAVAALHAKYSASERASWAAQLSGAQIVVAGGTDALITILAAAQSKAPLALAQTIVAKNEAYLASYATALATLQATRNQIEAATAIDQLPALSLQYVTVGPMA